MYDVVEVIRVVSRVLYRRTAMTSKSRRINIPATPPATGPTIEGWGAFALPVDEEDVDSGDCDIENGVMIAGEETGAVDTDGVEELEFVPPACSRKLAEGEGV